MDTNFTESAKGLSKNPLGIIALFISLIYVMASLVLSVNAASILPNERFVLIWFIVVFPVAILGSFIFLVVKHPNKLYSPGDFRADQAYLTAQSFSSKSFTNVPATDNIVTSVNSIEVSEAIKDDVDENEIILQRLLSNAPILGIWAILIAKRSIDSKKGISFASMKEINKVLDGIYIYGWLGALSAQGYVEIASINPAIIVVNLHTYLIKNIEETVTNTKTWLKENDDERYSDFVSITQKINEYFAG